MTNIHTHTYMCIFIYLFIYRYRYRWYRSISIYIKFNNQTARQVAAGSMVSEKAGFAQERHFFPFKNFMMHRSIRGGFWWALSNWKRIQKRNFLWKAFSKNGRRWRIQTRIQLRTRGVCVCVCAWTNSLNKKISPKKKRKERDGDALSTTTPFPPVPPPGQGGLPWQWPNAYHMHAWVCVPFALKAGAAGGGSGLGGWEGGWHRNVFYLKC